MKEIEAKDFVNTLILMNICLKRELSIIEKEKLEEILEKWNKIYEDNKITVQSKSV